MTTVAYLKGQLACDSMYSFSEDNPSKTALFNTKKYQKYRVPKAIKLIEKDFEIIIGVSAEARFSALTHDHFQYNFGNVGIHLNPNHSEYIIDELSYLYDQLYTEICSKNPKYLIENPKNEVLVYLLLVVNGVTSVYYFIPMRKKLILDEDTFPAIGTGRQHIKDFVFNNPNKSVVDAISYTINKDIYSGYPIQTDVTCIRNDNPNKQPLETFDAKFSSNYRENLDKGISLLNEEIAEKSKWLPLNTRV